MKFILLLIVPFIAVQCLGQEPLQNNSNAVPELNAVEEESNKSKELITDSVMRDSRDEDLRELKVSSKKVRKDKGYSSIQQVQSQSVTTLSKAKTSTKYQSYSRSPSPQNQQIMDQEVERLRKIDDNSFDYHLYNYVSGNYDVSREKSLYQAEKLNKDNVEVQQLLVGNSLIQGDANQAKDHLTTLVKKGALSKETIAYTEDVLLSAKGNDILLTHGTNDTYGAIYNQYIQPKRFEEICVVSLDLIRSDSYRTLLEKKGISVPKKKMVDVDYFKEFCALNSNKGISISMTFPSDYLRPVAASLIPYGLVFRMGKQKALCANDLEELWNEEMNKKNLYEFNSAESKNYSKNYAPAAMILKEYRSSSEKNLYMQKGQKVKIQKKQGGIEKKH